MSQNGDKPAITIHLNRDTLGVHMSFDMDQIKVGWDGVLMILGSCVRSAEHELTVQRARLMAIKAKQIAQEQAVRTQLGLG